MTKTTYQEPDTVSDAYASLLKRLDNLRDAYVCLFAERNRLLRQVEKLTAEIAALKTAK